MVALLALESEMSLVTSLRFFMNLARSVAESALLFVSMAVILFCCSAVSLTWLCTARPAAALGAPQPLDVEPQPPVAPALGALAGLADPQPPVAPALAGALATPPDPQPPLPEPQAAPAAGFAFAGDPPEFALNATVPIKAIITNRLQTMNTLRCFMIPPIPCQGTPTLSWTCVLLPEVQLPWLVLPISPATKSCRAYCVV